MDEDRRSKTPLGEGSAGKSRESDGGRRKRKETGSDGEWNSDEDEMSEGELEKKKRLILEQLGEDDMDWMIWRMKKRVFWKNLSSYAINGMSYRRLRLSCAAPRFLLSVLVDYDEFYILGEMWGIVLFKMKDWSNCFWEAG